jgi:hypothetical protein
LGLFGRAKNLLKGVGSLAEPRVQYYNVVCPLGHRVRGQRTEGYQALRCPACGEGVFVLPLSPLPEPIAPERSTTRRAPVAATGRAVEEGPIELHDPAEVTVELQDDDRQADAEIIWDDEPAGGEDAAARPPTPDVDQIARDRRRSAAKRAKAKREAPAAQSPRRKAGRATAAAVEEPRIEVRTPRRRSTRPFLIFGLVAMVVVGTVALRVWRGRRQQYPLVAELGRVEGIPALEQGEFDKAYQLLAPARKAVDALGGAVEGADQIRQAADEADVFINLIPETLEDLFDEAARTDPQRWTTKFESYYQDRAVIFDTRIRTTPESEAKRYELDYMVMPVGEASSFRGGGGSRPERTARIDLEGFELFKLAEPKVGDRVVFGARLDAFLFDAAAGSWVVRLRPKSGVFIRHSKALEALGWPPAADVEPDAGGP